MVAAPFIPHSLSCRTDARGREDEAIQTILNSILKDARVAVSNIIRIDVAFLILSDPELLLLLGAEILETELP